MPSFCSIVENEKYSVGCTGQTVWVWDKTDTVLAKFKDLIYAYHAAISPRGDMFAVKSTDGRLAVYSLGTMALIKKFRFSKVNCAQDDGFCFSSNGKYFLNIERHREDCRSALSVYNTEDFSLSSSIFLDGDTMISHIQEVGGEYYVLGFIRRNAISHFVAKFKNDEICDVMHISEREYDFYCEHLEQTMFGSNLNDGQKIDFVHTLAVIWNYYNEKQKS